MTPPHAVQCFPARRGVVPARRGVVLTRRGVIPARRRALEAPARPLVTRPQPPRSLSHRSQQQSHQSLRLGRALRRPVASTCHLRHRPNSDPVAYATDTNRGGRWRRRQVAGGVLACTLEEVVGVGDRSRVRRSGRLHAGFRWTGRVAPIGRVAPEDMFRNDSSERSVSKVLSKGLFRG